MAINTENTNPNIAPLNHTLFTLSSDLIVPESSASFSDMLAKAGNDEPKSPFPLLGDKINPNDYQESLKNLAITQMRELQRI
ncbi:hypothetical protein LS70_009725 [Helicobacter sp. MIT 11-5569]|uniref:hypothetical protein n=1 Tax=Helicobacter sp. MIT 11-5569 TaxID=1548151 RepID=UPI00051FE0D5|nr:hypothetical protein [Helicobacter sp. MIT 11-5569]TLD79711.1 hypothetical protein LS70_009725 [Helicobacter sp. MIT 11-5569]